MGFMYSCGSTFFCLEYKKLQNPNLNLEEIWMIKSHLQAKSLFQNERHERSNKDITFVSLFFFS